MEVVLLGLCDGQLDPERYRSSYQTNKVGGVPDWLPAINGQIPRCGLCGASSALVVQIYCPVDTSPWHRNLHVFACTAPGCSGLPDSFTVLRSQGPVSPQHSRSQPVPQCALPATDWCDSAEDWGPEVENGGRGREKEEEEEEGSDVLSDIDISSHLQCLSLGELQEPSAIFCPFFISVVEEEELLSEDSNLEHAHQLLRDYEKREGAVATGEESDESGSSGEKYEKTEARHGDAVFCRFMKNISLCPQQILRYHRGGSPLLISHLPSNMAQQVLACNSCGGSRMFELQLMPALVSLLQRTDSSPEAELEFGTVLVYTCSTNCWISGSHSALEELCLVQSDPDQQLFT